MKTASLKELAEINPRFVHNGKMDTSEIVSFVPMADVSEIYGKITNQTNRPLGDVSKGFTPFQDKDVLVAKITPCFENGKIAHARIKNRWGFGSTEFHVLRPNPTKLVDRYLFYFVRQKRIRIEGERRMTGSAGQRRVPKAFIENLQIPFLPLAEQRRIAAILDVADALREKRRQIIAKLDELLPSVFLDMFGDPVTNSKGWEVDEIRNIGNVVTGSTPPSKLENMFGGDIPFVTPGDLENDEEETKRHVTPEGASRSRLVRKGSALICCIGATIGKMDIAYSDSAFNQQINAIEWGSRIDDLFGIQILRFFKKKIAAWGTSTTLPILKKSSFERIKVPVPPIEIQGQLAQRIAWIQRIKENYRQQREKFETLFASLQQRAFKGEL